MSQRYENFTIQRQLHVSYYIPSSPSSSLSSSSSACRFSSSFFQFWGWNPEPLLCWAVCHWARIQAYFLVCHFVNHCPPGTVCHCAPQLHGHMCRFFFQMVVVTWENGVFGLERQWKALGRKNGGVQLRCWQLTSCSSQCCLGLTLPSASTFACWLGLKVKIGFLWMLANDFFAMGVIAFLLCLQDENSFFFNIGNTQ